VTAGEAHYEQCRLLYTEELDAAARGAFAAGATEVVLMDCHGAGGERSFNSLVPEAIDARAEFVVQTTEYDPPGPPARSRSSGSRPTTRTLTAARKA
jgi:D-aminopeptidase